MVKFNSTKITAKAARIRLIGIIAIIVCAVIAWIVCQFGLGGYAKLGFHPILVLFMVTFLGIGIFYVAFAFIGKRTLMLVVGAPLAIIGLIFLFAILHVHVAITIVVSIALLIISVIAVITFKAPELVVEFDNDNEAEHKTYAEKQAEAAKLPPEEEKELPKIKSFKD